MSYRAIEWDKMLKIHEEHNITAINYQILDMTPGDMERKAFEAACHLKYLCDNHKVKSFSGLFISFFLLRKRMYIVLQE